MICCRLQADLRSEGVWNGASFFAETIGPVPDSRVHVRVLPDTEIGCQLLKPTKKGALWAAYWSEFGPFPTRDPDFHFDLRYQTTGGIHIDNNDHRGYTLNADHPWLVGRERVLMARACTQRFDNAQRYAEFRRSEKRLGDLLPDVENWVPGVLFLGWVQVAIHKPEKVGIRYTTDGWKTHTTCLGARVSDGQWLVTHFLPPQTESLEFKAGCLHQEKLDWDDNFGKNYFQLID